MWLPREISGLTVTTVYIPSRAHTELSLGKLFKAVNWQETACPEAASIVMVWILLLVLSYAVHADAGSVYRHHCTKDGAQDGSTERTTAQASSDSGFVPSQEAYFEETQDFSKTEAFDTSVTNAGSSGSRAFSFQGTTYTSSFQPLTRDLKPALSTSFQQASDQSVQTAYQQAGPAQSTYQQGVSYRPVQSTLPSSFDSRAYPYASSFKPSTSTSKPVQSGYQQKASDQPVQTAFQRVSSSQPVASSFQQVASAPPFPSASQRASSAKPVQSAYQQESVYPFRLGGFCSSVQITIFLCSGFEFPRQLSTLCWLSKINMDTKGAGVADGFHSMVGLSQQLNL
ncbi:hypothetical protein SRHO_G00275430 [Serrasalmus rhombeus]